MIYILIYLALGIYPGMYIAKKNYDKFEKTHDPSMFEIRYKVIAKSLHSIIYGLAFIVGTLLWPFSLIEMIGDHKNDKI